MKISTKSWHYRLLYFMWDDVRNTLCGYFWQLILTSIVLAVATTGIGFILYSLIFGLFRSHDSSLFQTSVIIWVAIICIAAFWIIMHFIEQMRDRKPSIGKPSLLSSYIGSIKKKICPVIEFDEEEDV